MPVRKFQGSGRRIGGFGALESGIHYRTVMDSDASLVHEHFDLIDLRIGAGSDEKPAQGVVISADDLLAGGFPAGFVVADTVAGLSLIHICVKNEQEVKHV